MEEILFVTATVARLDGEIDALNARRAALLRRLNQLRPPARVLPPETLALVFHYAAQHAPARASPLLLGAVCSLWRDVASSTPLLWTDIDPVPIRRNAQHSDAALLRLYFRNARALPVALHLKLDRLSSSPSAASEDILRAVFLENSRSIGALVCSSKSSLRQRWAMLAPALAQAHFPNLRRLEINLRGAPLSRFERPMFPHAPRLSRVLFSGYHLPHETFWEQITVLELSSLPVSQCLESLVRCPNLVHFRCTSPRPSHKPLDSAIDGLAPVTFPHLTKFEWMGSLAEWDVFLYSYVRLPNLHHLILGSSHPLSRPLDPTVPPSATDVPTTCPDLWKGFLRHMKCLSILECTVFHSSQEWLDIFDIFSSTVHTLRFTAFRDAEETVHLLRALQINYGGSAAKNYLPNLKSLSATLDLHPDRSKHVLDILCSRRVRPIVPVPPTPDSLSLNVTLDSSSDWSSLSDSVPSIVIYDPDSDSSSNPPLPIPPPPPPLSEETPSPASSSTFTPTPPPPPLPPRPKAANDYLINTFVDHDYWSTHTRLEEATIKCWPFGFDFGEREREIARSLKDGGLNLEVFGQANRVDWL
jgi:hypothetical protein